MTAYETGQDLLAETCRERWAAQFEGQRGDTWETRDGRAVIVASNRWPPPQPGSHAWETHYRCPDGDELAEARASECSIWNWDTGY